MRVQGQQKKAQESGSKIAYHEDCGVFHQIFFSAHAKATFFKREIPSFYPATRSPVGVSLLLYMQKLYIPSFFTNASTPLPL